MFFEKINKLLFYLVIASVSIVLASAQFLPMLDLSQHAAQIQALRSFFDGTTDKSWYQTVEVNYFTTYWFGYLVTFLLSFLFSIKTAINIVVAIAFVFFVISFSSLRRLLNGNPYIDWILIPAFFGFSYQFGLLTFILSIGFGVLLLGQNIRLIESFSKKRVIAIFVLGVILYFSHILIFLLFCCIAGLMTLVTNKIELRGRLRCLIPFFILMLLIPLYFIMPKILGQADLNVFFDDNLYSNFKYGSFDERVYNLFIYPWALDDQSYRPFSLTFITIALMFIPFLLGCQLSKRPEKYVPFAVFLLVWFLMPEHLTKVTFVAQRFSIFFFPFYLLIFEKRTSKNRRLSTLFNSMVGVWIVVSLWLVSYPIKDIFLFAEETKDFKLLMSELPEGKSALSIVYDRYGREDKRTVPINVYFPVWYQVLKNGWVEYNFAWFSPQVVRYKEAGIPENRPGFAWNPQQFKDFKKCDEYDLLIVKLPHSQYLSGFLEEAGVSSCSHKLYKSKGSWYIFSK